MDSKQQDSISTVGVGGKEYPPSEVYAGSEPPPAYQRPRATAVQIARIAAGTVIAVTFILGFFMLASAYISASASCASYNLQEAIRQEMEMDQPQYQHLVADPLQTEESEASKRESVAPPPPPSAAPQQQQEQDDSAPIQLKLPLTLDFDDIAGSLIEKNQRSRMNCVVEKRRAEEVMDHQPKTVRLPFGVNLTTDPRYEHVTGERMAIFCESGNDQRHVPVDNNIGAPVVVPIPFHEAMHIIPMPMPVPMGPHGPMFPPPPPHHMMPQQHQPSPQQLQQLIHSQPPMMPQHMPHPAQTQAQMPHHFPQQPHPELPLHILTRIAQEEADSKDDSPVHIIAREEVFPVFHPANPEGRALAAAPVPSEMVQPPPPPPQPQHYPRHIPAAPTQLHQLHPASDQPSRPHYVQPRSVRSVEDTFLKREKRVKRCACNCAC